MPDWSQTWTYIDGDWRDGNTPIVGPRTQAFWLGSSVFDGARAYEGVTPDLDRHLARVNASARVMGLEPMMTVDEMLGLVADGRRRFAPDAALYIRPMYWAEQGGYLSIPPDPDSTRFLLCLYEAAMPEAAGFSLTVSPFRRPTIETMPTDAKAGCLYPNNGRAIMEAKGRGFDNALVLDMTGNVAETGSSNVFMVRDGVVFTPVPNRTFLNGITRQRVIALLREDGVEVREVSLTVKDFLEADEIFSSGNYLKVSPVSRIEGKDLQPGPVYARAKRLYRDWAHAGSGR